MHRLDLQDRFSVIFMSLCHEVDLSWLVRENVDLVLKKFGLPWSTV